MNEIQQNEIKRCAFTIDRAVEQNIADTRGAFEQIESANFRLPNGRLEMNAIKPQPGRQQDQEKNEDSNPSNLHLS
ncbi:MAG TPA: hypothetical protein PLI07_00455, partial [Candidatus Hydrogenedentes bacterium]|nr:hypothetical protein [Candidatus Hydrogenedentota bacterium]